MWPDLGKPAFYTLGNTLRNSISKSNSNTLLVVAGRLLFAAINISSGGEDKPPYRHFRVYVTRGVSNRAKWHPRFQDLKISLGSQDFYGISIYGFLWISGFPWDLWEFYGIISVFYGNNRKNIAFGISDLGFQARFQHLRPRFQHLPPRFQLVADPSM